MGGTRPTAKAKALAALRISLGAGFLFAGLEKLLHFDGATKPFDATGFLKFATVGTLPGSPDKAIVNPTHDFWVALAGNPGLMSVINTLVVSGEILIGVALILGIAVRFAGVMGAVMMGFFWVANFSFANGPFNEQFFYGVIALYVAIAGAGEVWSLRSVLSKATVVKTSPRLAAVLATLA
jgi:thiosulfate dehydrogenase [quinone] large subunit